MKRHNLQKGKHGEEIAEGYLRKKGYKILERNWGAKWGEIDLVCVKDNVLVFVEVKLKVGDRFGAPEEMVQRRKLGQIMRMAEVYESKLELRRIDVVAVVLSESDRSVERISHYENVGF